MTDMPALPSPWLFDRPASLPSSLPFDRRPDDPAVVMVARPSR
jgi:hypothetical protein